MLVTDSIRHGFYAILDTGYLDDSEWEYKADALLSGGARLLQLRAMGDPEERVRELAERILPIARAHEVPLILNDRLELAASLPGVGLHMGQADGDIREARRLLGKERLLGLSTNSLEQAQAAIAAGDVLSYFTVGPVYRSLTHPDYEPVGLELVREVAALQPALPFFCIGGIDRDSLDAVIAAGARGVIAASVTLKEPDPAGMARFFANRLAR
jgi:thiamine-phosphate pyrophosphorylase